MTDWKKKAQEILLSTAGPWSISVDQLASALSEAAAAERERLNSKISIRLNDYLCEMQPNFDDSIVGFNEAWDIVRKVFDEIAAIRSRKEG